MGRDKKPIILPINHLIPNMMTMLSLCGGLMAIRYAILGKWEQCLFALVVSAILDTLDGRIARLLKVDSKFGAELDSLSDLVAFGVAPTFIIYLWSLQTAGPLGWIACLVFSCCAALRLARFNVDIGLGAVSDKPPFAVRYFTGVPTPAGAGLALLPLILSNALADAEVTAHVSRWHAVIVPWMFLIGALMISKTPTYSLKKLGVRPAYAGWVLLGAGLSAALMINAPWLTMTVLLLSYLASLPLAWRGYQRQLVRWEGEQSGKIEELVKDARG